MRKILCLDYDMTLYDHKANQIPQSAIEALNQVRDQYKIVLASGRYFNNSVNEHIKHSLHPDAIVHANGCVVEVDGVILHEAFLDDKLQESLIHFAVDHHLCMGGLYQGNWYSTNPEKLIARWSAKGNKSLPPIQDAKELIGKKMYSLYLDDTVESAKMIERTFPDIRAPIMSEKTGGADIIPRYTSKAFGVQVLLDYWKQTFDDVIAIGDSMNDYELIKQASVGIAMGNAVSGLQEIADYITTPIEQDGIRNALRYLKSI